ncbi:MAG: PKD domain-containing protein, partial [Halanaerobiaceae bacterium]|nr:PKD domain-containing protein [Halanaerobiaceae bacterium]
MLKKISIYFIISVTGILLSISVLADTHINVLPGVNVEVGEEVYFDGLYYYQDEYGISVNWEWDFGDGYTLKAGTPRETTFDTGLCVVHYFMKPGTYEVQLTVSRFDMDQSPPVRQELLHTDSVTIHVTGEALMEGFELRHAPFRVRTAQYLYALVPSGYSPEQVSVRLETAKGDLIKQLEGVTVDGKRRFLLENAKLPAGDYVVVAELKNGKETVSTIREKFSKPYDGAPAIGINENNAFVLIGEELFFPIGPWQLRKSSIPMWKWSSNILYCIGYYDVKDEAAWQDYVKTADSNNLKALGPVGWVGFNKRNGNPDIMAKYIEAAKDLDGLFGWCWDDEPNLGGRYNRVPATVLAAWSYRVNQRDPQHPTVQQYYGYDYLPNYNPLNGNHEYSYMRSAHLFGGKKAFTADFITYDIYPIENKGHASLKNPERGVIDLWAEALDNFVWNMDNLIPLGTFVETQNVTTWDRMSNNKYETEWDAGPTHGDLRTQLWTSIVHNMKAVLYFEFFAEPPMDNMSVLNEFYEAVTDLTPIILAPPSSLTVTHNCHERGKRVDLMVRETDTDYYIFAVRITEPESEWNELMEPETIEFVLDTGTKAAAAYDIFPGYRWEHLLVDVTEEKKSFQFDLKDGVRPGSVLLAVVDPKKISDKIPEKLVDMWTGKEYSGILDKQGIFLKGYDNGEGKIIPLFSWENIKGGTINYETGEMTVELKDNVPLGEDFIQISYAVEDRPIRTITGNNGVFRDTLERNAVRIYRIPKQVKPVIITQPEDQIAAAGGNIRFSVEAAGTDIHFQWQKDTGKGFADLRGKTDATLLLTNVRKDDEGLYRVRVYNNYGDEVYSEATRLEVTDPLPKVIEPDSIAVNKTVYHFWNNPEGQGEIWDKVYVIRKEGSEPLVVDDDSASVVYDGTGTSFIDTNLDEGIYYYAFYTYKDIGNNVVYSGPEVAGPVEIPAKYNKECVTVKAGPDQPLSIGQNTRGDLYSFWNEEKISIGRGPTGNESSLWFYSDIIGNGENQVPAKSKIVSARLVFHVEGYNFNEDETSHDLRDRTRSIELYRITDPDNLGRPYYAKESGIRAGLDYNYRDHRPGMKIPWIATEEEENYSGIADLLREIEPVDIIEFTADVFEDEGIKTLEFDVTEAVQAWADGAENQGIYITTGEGWDNGKYLELYGVDMEGAGQPGGPYLEIVYGNSGDLAAPGPVENISISTGTDSITLNWDNPSDTDFSGVRIVRKKGM